MNQVRESALSYLEQAIKAESEKHYDVAVECYARGIESLMRIAQMESRTSVKNRLLNELNEFMVKAERCKELERQSSSILGFSRGLFRSHSTRGTAQKRPLTSTKFASTSGPYRDNQATNSLSMPLERKSSLTVRRNSPIEAKEVSAKPSLTTEKRDADLEKIILDDLLDVSPGVRWSDIAGLHDAKQTLQEAVILPNLRPDLFTGLRAPPRGVLLYGPPGTGKTMLAKAVATESKFSFFCISASSLTSKYVGEGEKLVRALFRAAQARKPAVIFIDEVDSVLSARGSTEHEASRRLKTEFMVQLDGVCGEHSEGILVMGATNLPWELDEAVLRRLSRRVYVPLPEAEARFGLMKHLLRGLSVQMTDEELSDIIQELNGYSCSDISALTKEAAMIPLRELGSRIRTARSNQIRPVRKSDFEAALIAIRPSVGSQTLARFEQWESGMK